MAILVPIPSHQMKHTSDTSWPVVSPVTLCNRLQFWIW